MKTLPEMYDELAAECARLRAENEALKQTARPDCRTCQHYYTIEESCFLYRKASPIVCINGDAYIDHDEPVRLYETQTKSVKWCPVCFRVGACKCDAALAAKGE